MAAFTIRLLISRDLITCRSPAARSRDGSPSSPRTRAGSARSRSFTGPDLARQRRNDGSRKPDPNRSFRADGLGCERVERTVGPGLIGAPRPSTQRAGDPPVVVQRGLSESALSLAQRDEYFARLAEGSSGVGAVLSVLPKELLCGGLSLGSGQISGGGTAGLLPRFAERLAGVLAGLSKEATTGIEPV